MDITDTLIFEVLAEKRGTRLRFFQRAGRALLPPTVQHFPLRPPLQTGLAPQHPLRTGGRNPQIHVRGAPDGGSNRRPFPRVAFGVLRVSTPAAAPNPAVAQTPAATQGPRVREALGAGVALLAIVAALFV